MIGFNHAPELLILLVIAFLVFGPEKLPELARGAGRGLREFRRMSSELQQSISTTFEEPLQQVQQVHQEMQQQVQDVTRLANETLTQPWSQPFSSQPGQAQMALPEPATVNSTVAQLQHDEAHAAPVADVPAAHVVSSTDATAGAPPAPNGLGSTETAFVAPLLAGAGGRLGPEAGSPPPGHDDVPARPPVHDVVV